MRRIQEWRVQEYRMGSSGKRFEFLDEAVSQRVRQNSEMLASFDRWLTV
jgi:hypothetical protein